MAERETEEFIAQSCETTDVVILSLHIGSLSPQTSTAVTAVRNAFLERCGRETPILALAAHSH